MKEEEEKLLREVKKWLDKKEKKKPLSQLEAEAELFIKNKSKGSS